MNGNSKIGIDTMVFIYHFANHPTYSPITQRILSDVERGKLTGITSTITVAELYTLPEKQNDHEIIQAYEDFLTTFPHLRVESIDWHTARIASKIRAHHPFLRLPDALQIAATLRYGGSRFITNDKKLKKVKEIEVVLLKEY